jgi:hypothetical protein
MIAVPTFDIQACRQLSDMHPFPPTDEHELRRQWAQLRADLEAAADQVEILTLALHEARSLHVPA